MRSVGYSFEAALADLIDNSITAQATTVDIDGDVVDGNYVAILDDGYGMSFDIAREALRLAGSVSERKPQDLGRFGLGLKTASLSQARCLTVVTRNGSSTVGLRWDLDHIKRTNQWSLLILSEDEIEDLPLWDHLDRQTSGTLVVWTRLDLLLDDSVDRGGQVRERIVEASKSLSLVFHRYLGQGGLTIRVNGLAIAPTDPFLSSNPHTQESTTEPLTIAGQRIDITAYTLPHPSGMRADERMRFDLSEGMREAQGFYIYRNRRLISRGHWYGLATKSELTKQTRIKVDLPNTLDDLWHLDIKKSRAVPPASFRSHLKRIIDPLLDKGRRVHTFRGRKEIEQRLTRVWEKVVDRQNFFRYVVNENHPLISSLREQLSDEESRLLEEILEMISSEFPIHDLYAEMAQNKVSGQERDEKEVIRKLRYLLLSGVLGTNALEVAAQLRNVEPFNRVSDLKETIEKVMEDEWKDAE